MENEEEIIVTDIDTTTNDVQDSVETEVAPHDNEIENLKKTISTLEAQKEHWREKAERKAKETPTKESKASQTDTTEDLYALMRSNVHPEDISDVKEIAKIKGISISEALKTGAVKAILAEKEEQRTVSLATNTGGTKRSSGKISDETLISNAQSGKLPESDDDIARLVKYKMFGNRK